MTLDGLYVIFGITPLILIGSLWAQYPFGSFMIITALASAINPSFSGVIGWHIREIIPIILIYYFALYLYTSYFRKTKPQPKSPTPPPKNQPTLPPLDIFSTPKTQRITVQDQRVALLEALKNFGIEGTMHGFQTGPAVTQYEFEPAPGVKVSKIISLSDDIARSMSAMSTRVTKIPGQNFVGIEVANPSQETVYFKEIAQEIIKSDCALPLGLGKDIAGMPFIDDLAKMPHLLVAGTTGSGKSVAMHSMLLSLLCKLDHKKLRLLLIDPKMLEFAAYKDIPHLLHPVVTDSKEAISALKWAVNEMERRYKALSDCGVRNIVGYNQQNQDNKLPYIIVIVDEFADLMSVAGKEVEFAVQRLAQMARASGIHIIIATQRPSVDVITGTIKANFPSRISFQVSSQTDSRTILNEQGAEQLLGRGDMLYMNAGGKPKRLHGPFVTEKEVTDVVSFLKGLGKPEYIDVTTDASTEIEDKETDPRYEDALELIRRTGKVSTSFLVTNMGIGYNRASRMIQEMERRGVISPPQGSTHTRQILK